MKTLSEPLSKLEIGYGGNHTNNGTIRADEWDPEIRGKRWIRKCREMRDSDSTIGAVCYATEQILRDVKYEVVPADDSEQAKKEAQFLEEVLADMEHTLDDHISEALSFLTFGFAIFEVVYKRRVGPNQKDRKKRSKYTDGRIGIRKLASRAQWTLERFEIDKETGDLLGFVQDRTYTSKGKGFLPIGKCIHYKTTNTNNDPSGRSILRNAYKSYTFLTNVQRIEAIAIERELTGIPVGRMPADYMSSDATEAQAALRQEFERVLRDLKFNDQGYILLPSDLLVDSEGKATGGVGSRLMDVELISANGTRNIEIRPVVNDYQRDIAMSILADFVKLGNGDGGSYALSKSKTDLFLKAQESYIQTMVDILNKQLVEPLWQINGLDYKVMPRIEAGDVVPHDLENISRFLRNLNGAKINVADHAEVVADLMEMAELEFDKDAYVENIEERKALEESLRRTGDEGMGGQPGQPRGNQVLQGGGGPAG